MIRKKERATIEPFPHDGFVNDEQIAYFVGVHCTTIWAWVKRGKLPPPIKLSAGVTRWNAAEVRKFLFRGDVTLQNE